MSKKDKKIRKKKSSEKVAGVIGIIIIVGAFSGFIFGLSAQESVDKGMIPSEYLSDYCTELENGFNCRNNIYMTGIISAVVAAASVLLGIHKKSDYRTRLIFTSLSWISGIIVALLFL